MVRACRPPAREPGRSWLGAPLDDGDIDAGQRQLARQHQPRRTASGDHHRMLGHRASRRRRSLAEIRVRGAELPRSPQGVKTEQTCPEHRRRVQPRDLGVMRHDHDAGRDPGFERRVGRLEDAAGERDVQVAAGHVQPMDDGHAHGRDLVCQPIDDASCDGVVVLAAPKTTGDSSRTRS